MTTWYVVTAIVGLGVVTVITRGFFLLSDREWRLPHWADVGLRYAPLAALAAVIAPEIVFTNGRLIDTWQSPRLWAALASTLFFIWRRSILGTIVIGTLVNIALRLGLGW